MYIMLYVYHAVCISCCMYIMLYVYHVVCISCCMYIMYTLQFDLECCYNVGKYCVVCKDGVVLIHQRL